MKTRSKVIIIAIIFVITLGIGTTLWLLRQPESLELSVTSVTVSAGRWYTTTIDIYGSLWTWGANLNG